MDDNGPTHLHLFPQVGSEIRLQIWGHVCDIGRDVWIGVSEVYDGSLVDDDDHGIFRFELERTSPVFKYVSKQTPPAILQVNSEARAEGLKKYTLTFGVNLEFGEVEVRCKPHVYVNFEIDRICLGSTIPTPEGDYGPWSYLADFPIRRIAIPWDISSERIFDAIWQEERVFWKGIEEITLYDPMLKNSAPDLGIPMEEILGGDPLSDLSFNYWTCVRPVLADWITTVMVYGLCGRWS